MSGTSTNGLARPTLNILYIDTDKVGVGLTR